MDKKILSDWVKLQAAYEGSERKLNRKIGVSQEHIRYWRDQKVDWLKEDSIEKIAKYRNETPLQTRAWVTGKTVPEYVTGELKGLPKHLLMGVFEKIHDMLSTAGSFSGKVKGDFHVDKDKMCSPVGRLIIEELNAAVQRGDFPDFQSAMDRFIESCNFLPDTGDIEIMQGVFDGRAEVGPNLLGVIAIALEAVSGNPRYNFYYLSELLKSPAHNENRACQLKNGNGATVS